MISYTFVQRNPLVFTALVVFFILYIFLSFIFSFLVFICPFLVYTAILVRIFWSSEQTQLIYAKREEKKGEKDRVAPNHSNTAKSKKHGRLIKYPSQNATSRRRNFTGRKLDVYGDLEQKAKDLSEVFQNEFTSKSTKFKEYRSFRKEKGYWDYELSTEKIEVAPTNQTLFSEPLMHDLVDYGAGSGVPTKEIEDKMGETKAEEGSNKLGETNAEEGSNITSELMEGDKKSSNITSELMEDDEKNDMDLRIAETERTKRLESLIARRRARKILKLKIEKGLVDMKSVVPGQIAPLSITRVNLFYSSKESEIIDGIEMPGSAPTALRSPYDIPYDPFEEKPVLTGDGFEQEFITPQKDMMFTRHESFAYGSSFPFDSRQDWLLYPRNRRHLGKGNHDWLEQLICKQGSENESKAHVPFREGEENRHEVDEKCESNVEVIKDEQVENTHATKSKPNHTSKQDWTLEITNMGRDIDSVYESLPSLADKNQGDMFLTDRRISHTPSYSLASDLQVEVSEVGSPTLTVDESHDTITTTDVESMIYDGDIDKDVISGSEDMWGASLHAREVHIISEQDVSEVSNWKVIVLLNSLQNIEEENAADMSSMSSKSDILEDTPIAAHAISSDHNMFGNVDYFMGGTNAPHPSHSSRVSSRRRRLVDNSHVDHIQDQIHSEKPEEWYNLSDNLISKTQDINDVNNSTSIEQDNTQNSKSSTEDHDTSIGRQETIDEVSINSSSSSSSPRSVLLPKAMADQASSSSYNQEVHLGVQQSSMENMAQATSNGEGPLDPMPQNIQPLMDDLIIESHNIDQERSYSLDNSNQASIMSGKMNDVYKETSKNDENNENKFSPLIRQDTCAEPSRLAEMKISENMDEKSRYLFDDKVPLNSPMTKSSSEVFNENNEDESQASTRQKATMKPFINSEATEMSHTRDFESKHDDLNKHKATIPSGSSGESDNMDELHKQNHISKELNFSQSETKQMNGDHMKQAKWDRGNIYEDSPMLPVVTELTNAEITVGESNNMNKNDAMVLSELTRKSDHVSNNTDGKA